MKAILKVKSGSAYEHLNGHTFEVWQLASNGVDLTGIYPDRTDNYTFRFTFSEILIVDLETEYRVREAVVADPHVGEGRSDRSKIEIVYLQRYCIANGFEFNIISNP